MYVNTNNLQKFKIYSQIVNMGTYHDHPLNLPTHSNCNNVLSRGSKFLNLGFV